MTANAGKLLLQHYVDNFRRLPWRAAPGAAASDPYRVWLSEVMLQQTTVAAVAPRFERFVGKWPRVEALAAASDEEVLSEWAGLGYYARARNLIACARQVATRGGFPTSSAELCRLPGIGRYTSAAIAAIAFGEQVVPVDTNVRRVVSRLHGLRGPSAVEVERLAAGLIPSGRAGDFAQALMDLGSTICRARHPRCGDCPLRSECMAFASGQPEAYPQRPASRVRPLRHGVCWWIERNGHVWLVRRPAEGMLGGMAALPGPEWKEERTPDEGRSLGVVRHLFTHFALELRVVTREDAPGGGWWYPLREIEAAGLPTLYRKAAALAVGSAGRLEPAARSAA